MEKIKRELSGIISLEQYRDLTQENINDYSYIASGINVRGLGSSIRRVFLIPDDPEFPNGPEFRMQRIVFYPKGKVEKPEEGDFRFYRECSRCATNTSSPFFLQRHLWDIRTGLSISPLEGCSFNISKEICPTVTSYYEIARDPAQVAELRGVGYG